MTLDEIMAHPWLAEEIPVTLPSSTLACPPSANYLAKFKDNIQYVKAHEPIYI
jgi:hypothetical protein